MEGLTTATSVSSIHADDPSQSRINLFLIAFHALMIGFVAGSPIPAFEAFANDFDVSIDAAAYIVSIQARLSTLLRKMFTR